MSEKSQETSPATAACGEGNESRTVGPNSGTGDGSEEQDGDGRISARKLLANRRNGHKGGVKTPEGKRKSRRNALKHYMRADTLVKEDDGSPASEEFRKLREAFEDEHGPRTATEYIIVEQMAMGAQQVKNGFRFQRAELRDPGAFQFPLVDRVARYQAAGSRLFFKSRAELAKLLAEETEEPEQTES